MKGTVSACLVILSCGSALGADLLRKGPAIITGPSALSSEPASNWSGFYLGANASGGMSYVGSQTLAEIADQRLVSTKLDIDRKGAMGGLQAGFALQSGAIVYGIEGDIGFGALRGSLNVATPDGSTTAHLKSSITSLGTVRGRVGYAFDNVLVYGTGGYATAHHDGKGWLSTSGVPVVAGAALTPAAGTPLGSASVHEWVHGWTLGAGAEYAFTRNVGLKVEYLYAQLNNRIAGQSVSHSLNLVRTGVNYRF